MNFGGGDVYVSFSGGKDSTVLLDIVRSIYPDVVAVFVDTGLEFPEIREFVKTKDNVIWLVPKYTFKQVVDKYGYPFFSKEIANTVYYARKNVKEGKETLRVKKLMGTMDLLDNGKKSLFNHSKYKFMLDAPFEITDKCCQIMKHNPIAKFNKAFGLKPFIGQLACESKKRTVGWMKTGCNAFDSYIPQSNPMAFWTEQDVLLYIKNNNLPICSVYGDVVEDVDEKQISISNFENSENKELFDLDRPLLKTTGCDRTGCVFCAFGCTNEKESRFERLKESHPKMHEYLMKPTKVGGLGYKEIIDWINSNSDFNIKY